MYSEKAVNFSQKLLESSFHIKLQQPRISIGPLFVEHIGESLVPLLQCL